MITPGILLILTPLTRSVFERARLPPLVGYIALGLVVSLLDNRWGLATREFEHVFSALAQLGSSSCCSGSD